jgi:hypothetical protein
MRALVIATMCVLPLAGAEAELPTTDPGKSFLVQAFGPKTFARAGASAVLVEVTNSPEEWGRGVDGLGIRFASAYGKHLIGTSVQFSVSTLRHEDLHYFPSTDRTFAGRMKHALVSTVVARNALDGSSMMAAGRVSCAFASGFGSRVWMPERYHTFASGMNSAGVSLGLDAGMNVFREFWPKRRH